MTKFRDGLLGPTVILFAICFVITFALAGVYTITAPVIREGEIRAANEARRSVLEAADVFTRVEGLPLPQGVTDAYRADNGAGYVFTTEAKGFGGMVVYMVGMDAAGDVVGINMFSHEETPGLGTKIGEMEYLENFYGSVDPRTVDAVSGATRTTNSLKNALAQAKEAYELVG